MSTTAIGHRLTALLKMNGAGRLLRLRDELPGMVPRSLTPDQLTLLDHLIREIERQAIRERDDAVAVMGETTQ